MSAAVTFAAVGVGLYAAHRVADHWVQTGHQSLAKGQPGWSGRWACAKHVATYTLTTAGTVALLWVVLGLAITPLGFLLGQTISAVSHYWADRRFTLARLCERIGKGGFYRLGAPRAGRDDNPSLGTGAYALDQSWHYGWLFVAALLTAVV
ncbi:MAG: transcriptional regulator [Acidimicrobiales bacterium]